MHLFNSALAAATASVLFLFAGLAPGAHATSTYQLTDSSNLTVRVVVSASDGITGITAINEDVPTGAEGSFDFEVVGLISPKVNALGFDYRTDKPITLETVFGTSQISLSVTIDEILSMVGPFGINELIAIPGSNRVNPFPQQQVYRGSITASGNTVPFEITDNERSVYTAFAFGAVDRVDEIQVESVFNNAAFETTIEGIDYRVDLSFSTTNGAMTYTPEPSTASLAGLGLLVLGAMGRRKRS